MSDSQNTTKSASSGASTQPAPALQASGISKRFPGVLALDQVDLNLAVGEVLAVIGENGAGKSTLMKILAGIQAADAGEIRVNGEIASFRNTREAQSTGIALIHQELNLCDNLDIASNIFLGRESSFAGFLRSGDSHKETQKLLDRVGLNIRPTTPVIELSIGQQQMVEIAKALSIEARILIMDEPTSSLTASETNKLFDVIRQLRSEGVGVIYISHRLREVREIADRVTVLRDGTNAGELPKEQIDHDSMVSLMVGRDLSQFYARKSHEPGPVVLEVKDLVTRAWAGEANNLQVRRGEIIGLAGLVGAGRTELLHCLFGIDQPVRGTIRISGNDVTIRKPADAIRHRIALVPEDRKQHGLLLDWNIGTNISLPQLDSRFSRRGFVSVGREAMQAKTEIDRLKIRCASAAQLAGLLSGGNQQKVVIGKWLASDPEILLLDEPTRGIDIGAKQEIYSLMERLAGQGMAILFVSSEMEEVIGMSDRVLVMHEGRITGQLDRADLDEEKIMSLATSRS